LYVDPTGELLVFAGTAINLARLSKLANDSLNGYELVINKNGTAQLVANNIQGPPSPEQQALASVLSSVINRNEVVRIGVLSGASDVRIGNYFKSAIDVQDIEAVGSGIALNSASALAHEIAELETKQLFGLTSRVEDYVFAHQTGIAAQNRVSGFTRSRINEDLFDRGTGNGYTLTEQTQGAQTISVIIKWVNGNIVKVIRK
jgi:hypothetical protein